MNNQIEIKVSNGRKPYGKPMIEVINLKVESIICSSNAGAQTEAYEDGEFTWS